MISVDDFKKIEVKIGEIVAAEKVEGADKLLKLSVDFGEETPRQVVSGIAMHVLPEALIGKKFPFATNLEPRTIRGIESQAMIMAASNEEGGFALLLLPIATSRVAARSSKFSRSSFDSIVNHPLALYTYREYGASFP